MTEYSLHRKYDAALNDSDKSWTVPDGETWEILYAHVIFTSTATVGNRQLRFIVKDASGNIAIDVHAGTVQAASVTARHYSFKQGVYRETTVVDGELECPIPEDCVALGGDVVQFKDNAAIAAAADDMTVSFTYRKL